jgi:polyhydroxybutyrate depolymerase
VVFLVASCSGRAPDVERPTTTESIPSSDATSSVSAPQPDIRQLTLTSGGIERAYRLFVPDDASPAGGFPLVLVFHGGLGVGDGAAQQTGFDEAAATRGWLVAYPDGVGRTWNAGICCNPALRRGIDDVAFSRDLVADIDARFGIDPARVYATGFSNGAMLTYRLACEASDLFAAFAPVSATLGIDCDPAYPVSVLHIHGTADENVPIDGGFGTKSIVPIDWPPARSGLERIASVDGCDPEPTETRTEVSTFRWGGCDDAAAVEYVVVPGGGHSWPRGDQLSPGLDPPSPLLDATATIADFFEAHPLEGSG